MSDLTDSELDVIEERAKRGVASADETETVARLVGALRVSRERQAELEAVLAHHDAIHDDLAARFEAGQELRNAIAGWLQTEGALAVAFCGQEPVTEPGSSVDRCQSAIRDWDAVITSDRGKAVEGEKSG